MTERKSTPAPRRYPAPPLRKSLERPSQEQKEQAIQEQQQRFRLIADKIKTKRMFITQAALTLATAPVAQYESGDYKFMSYTSAVQEAKELAQTLEEEGCAGWTELSAEEVNTEYQRLFVAPSEPEVPEMQDREVAEQLEAEVIQDS